jgi:hypothetical protein
LSSGRLFKRSKAAELDLPVAKLLEQRRATYDLLATRPVGKIIVAR